MSSDVSTSRSLQRDAVAIFANQLPESHDFRLDLPREAARVQALVAEVAGPPLGSLAVSDFRQCLFLLCYLI